MSGETETNVSGWTVDTLHTHVQRQINTATDLIHTRADEVKELFHSQLTGLEQSHQHQIHDLQDQIIQRFEREAKAVDVAFSIHREHTQIALDNADEAVRAALSAAEKAVLAALNSAEKAVDKVETSNEKRFESVNEFRAQLADQARTFMTRSEATAIVTATNDRLGSESQRVSERMQDINTRLAAESVRVTQRFDDLTLRLSESLDRATSRYNEIELRLSTRIESLTAEHVGRSGAKADARLDQSSVIGIIGAIVAVVSVAVAILLATRGV